MDTTAIPKWKKDLMEGMDAEGGDQGPPPEAAAPRAAASNAPPEHADGMHEGPVAPMRVPLMDLPGLHQALQVSVVRLEGSTALVEVRNVPLG